MEELLSLVKNQPKNIEAKMMLAKKYIDNNDSKSAQSVLEEIIQIDNNHLDANYILTQIYEFDEEYTKAISCLEKIINAQPSLNFKYKLAQLYESAENYESALSHFMDCFKSAPDDNDLLEKIAHVNRILGNDDIAIDFYNKLLASNSNDIVALTQLMELYEDNNRFLYYSTRAKIHLLEGALTYAATSFKKAIPQAENEKDIIETRLAIADIHVIKNDLNQAIDEYMAILELDKDHLQVAKKLAEAYHKLENYDAASEAYESILAKFPDDLAILKNLADIYLEQEENTKALKLLEKITSAEPENYSAFVELARVNIMLNNEIKALQSLNYVLEKDSKNVETRSVLTDFYIMKKDSEKALLFAEEIKKLIPKSPFGYKKLGEIYEILKKAFESHYNFGIYHDLKGEKQLAIDEFTCALEYEPENIDLLRKLANLYLDISEDYIAIEYYQRAYTSDKENLEILNSLADLYLKVKEYESAVQVYTKILNISDKNKDIYFTVAELHEKLRRHESALDYYNKFIELAPLSMKTEKAQAKIEKLSSKLNHGSDEEGLFDKIFRFFSRNKE